MNCPQVRDRLLRIAAGEDESRPVAHLASCQACTAFAHRIDGLRHQLQDHTVFEPDAYFAERIVARLPRAPEVMGRAALKFLPATLALALVLSGFCFLQTPTPTSLLAGSPSDDPVGWVLDLEEMEP
jgi:hypothetical protein